MELLNIIEAAFWLCVGTGVTICLCGMYEEYQEFKEFEYLRNGGGDGSE